jgi:endonuclease/exonuclease/phosphatase family metal-dependent hydrolase
VPDRQNTWNTLKNIAETQNRPWAVIGDFNEVLNLSEHDGVGSRSQAQIDGFREAVDTCGLSDIGHTGTNWTFERKVAGGTFTRVRLDRCLANPEWLVALPASTLHHKTAASSDHIPILLMLRDLHACRAGPRAGRVPGRLNTRPCGRETNLSSQQWRAGGACKTRVQCNHCAQS